MVNNFLIFALSLFFLVKGATWATKYAGRVAESFHLSKYLVGFLIVAVVSILPETFIAINSASNGMPSFGLGTLFGSNVADLTLIIAIIIAVAGRGLKIDSKILKNNNIYPFLLLLPIGLGLDGNFSRWEGVFLVIFGLGFYYHVFKNGLKNEKRQKYSDHIYRNLALLLVSMAVLLVSSHFTVESAVSLAQNLNINPVLIGMLVVGLGTTMPEFLFSLKSVIKKEDELAVGDILGTVLADATIVVGVLALVSPVTVSKNIIYVTGMFMVLASILLFYFMRSGRVVSKRESYLLLSFWLFFVIVEFIVNR